MSSNESIPPGPDQPPTPWHSLTRPPYGGLPWLVLLYVLVSSLIYTANGPFTGHIVGFDDQVRMTQVIQFINSGNWYDRVIHRVNAPEGFETIWARIVDLPIALVIVTAQLLTDQRTAGLVASVLVPLAELYLLFRAARYAARPLAGKNEAWLVLLFIMFTTALNHRAYTLAGFHLGEASHHAWYGILNVLLLGAATRLALGLAQRSAQYYFCAAVALLLAVGVEGIPIIAGTVCILALLSWFFKRPHVTRRTAQALGMATIASLALLPLHVPPERFFDVSYLQPSILGPTLIGTACLCLLVQYAAQRMLPNRMLNGAVTLLTAAVFAMALLHVFPGLQNGSLSGLSPNERNLAMNEHPEVWTMRRVAGDNIDFASLIIPTLLALCAAVFGVCTTRNKRRRMLFMASGGFALVPGAMAQLYWRYIHHAQTAVCPLLLWSWQQCRTRLPLNENRTLAAAAALIALGPFWFVFLPALNANAPFLTQVVFFPAKIYTEPYSCDTLSMTGYLSRHYAPNVRVIVPDWDSATFLYETNLKIDFLSNYPSHDHFIDNRAFFQSQDVETPRKIAAAHNIDLVAACVQIPMPPAFAASRPNRQPLFIERLKEGIAPKWLRRVNTGIISSYNLYEVDLAALAAAKDTP